MMYPARNKSEVLFKLGPNSARTGPEKPGLIYNPALHSQIWCLTKLKLKQIIDSVYP